MMSPSMMYYGSSNKTIKNVPEISSVFAQDSTATLIKKFVIYKAMGSNLFINYSLGGVHLMYKLFGMKLTNALIEKTAGSLFTGGVDLEDVKLATKQLH